MIEGQIRISAAHGNNFGQILRQAQDGVRISAAHNLPPTGTIWGRSFDSLEYVGLCPLRMTQGELLSQNSSRQIPLVTDCQGCYYSTICLNGEKL